MLVHVAAVAVNPVDFQARRSSGSATSSTRLRGYKIRPSLHEWSSATSDTAGSLLTRVGAWQRRP
jgi:hypothetical protein